MAYRTDPIRPAAKIVLQTDTQSQMDEILLALSRAVESSRHRAQQPAETTK